MRIRNPIAWRALAVLALTPAACVIGPRERSPAPDPVAQAAFVVQLGADTVALESYQRFENRIEGRQVVRSPQTVVRDYVALLNDQGHISEFAVSFQRPGEAAPYLRADIAFGTDSATVRIQQGDSLRTLRAAAPPGTVPLLGNSYVLYEQALKQARDAGQDSAAIPVLGIGAPRADSITVRRLGPDSVRVTNIAGANRVRVDEAGRLLAWNGQGSTVGVTAERVPMADIDSLAAAFAARDRQGLGLGTLSPTDSVAATVNGASLVVVYGRPAKRGRTIFGGVVPWNQVWRTGANAATRFLTDRDLRVGGVTVPAGAYTLWTIPSPDGWKLIINRQAQQFGTEYDPAHDLARIDMQRTPLADPAERFTIGIEPQGQGGELWMAWDDTRVAVPFTVQ